VLRLIVRALRSRPGRFWMTVGGIAVCTVLVLALQATHRSVAASVRTYLGQPGMDLWVAPRGSDNFMRSSALLADGMADSLLSVDGVAAADPVARAFVTVKSARGHGPSVRRLALMGVGYRAPDGLGGPPMLAEGRAPSRRNDVVLDRAAAWRLGTAVGDTLWINGRGGIVTGLAEGTNLLATHLVFANLSAVAGMSGIRGRASFVIVRIAPDARTDVVAEAIRERFPALNVFARGEFLAANLREIGAGFLPVLSLIGLLGVLAAGSLIALLSHAVVEQSRAEIAVLLALGSSVRGIGTALIGEALLLAGIGFVTGFLMIRALDAALARWWPVVLLPVSPDGAAMVLTLFVMAGVVAALLPLLGLRRIDPLEAFRP